MERLSEVLRAAVADPPPTSIEIDRLIGHHRRGQVQFRVGAAAGAAILATAAVAVPAVLTGSLGGGLSAAGPGGGCPTFGSLSPILLGGGPSHTALPTGYPPVPSASIVSMPPVTDNSPAPGPSSVEPSPKESVTPLPTANCDATIDRFTTQLRRSLDADVGARQWHYDVGQGRPPSFGISADSYLARVLIGSGGNQSDLSVSVRAGSADELNRQCATTHDCRTETDGVVVRVGTLTSIAHAVTGSPTGGLQMRTFPLSQVQIARPDGTLVNILLAAVQGGSTALPLTIDQIIALGRQFTLYP